MPHFVDEARAAISSLTSWCRGIAVRRFILHIVCGTILHAVLRGIWHALLAWLGVPVPIIDYAGLICTLAVDYFVTSALDAWLE